MLGTGDVKVSKADSCLGRKEAGGWQRGTEGCGHAGGLQQELAISQWGGWLRDEPE